MQKYFKKNFKVFIFNVFINALFLILFRSEPKKNPK
jgi:hypothetical protein